MPGLKKFLLVFLILLFILLPGVWRGRENNSLLRLHIRANSDSYSDQSVKYLVRNRVLSVLDRHLLQAASQAAAVQRTAEMLPAIQAAAQAALAEAGCSYRVRVTLGDADFPTRMYGSRVYRAGRYKALQIFLGEGQGKNWWCVLFPPLCFIGLDGEKGGEEVAAAENEVAAAEDTERDFFPLSFKSRLLEWLRRLFGGS